MEISPRQKLTNALTELSLSIKQSKESMSSNQPDDEGSFNEDFMRAQSILKPPFDPHKLCRIVENSSIIPQCIDAMVKNTDGFGHQLFYTGDIQNEKSEEVLAERDRLLSFFKKVNEKESFRTVRKNMRYDYETTGNGYLEIIRTLRGEIGVIYHADTKYVRLQKKQTDPVEINVIVYRNGKEETIKVKKRFRRFVMVTNAKFKKYKWFKEYGDPRKMNTETGKYEGEEGYATGNEATEMLHFKIGNGVYGIPRWTGNVATAMGLHSADFVNYDLFENQVVPPLAIMVSGGRLTSESVKDLENILLRKKGAENFNKVLILEAMTEGDISDKTASKIEMKEMSTARKEDSMFTQYMDSGEHRIRGCFRLPPLYLGRADTYSKSTADSSKMVAEEQVFVPEREDFDEVINLTIMEELGAKYHEFKSKGPRLIAGEQIIDGFTAFGKLGVFSINEGIRLANRTLGLDITTYNDPWSDYPIAIVIELAKLGILNGVDEISTLGDNVAGLLDNMDDPEKAAKAYTALVAMHKKLKEYADKRQGQEEENEPKNGFNEPETEEL